MGTCGLLIYKKILLIDYHSGNPSTGKSIEPFYWMGTCGLLIYKKILLIDYHSGNPSTGKSIEPILVASGRCFLFS
jgi:hypothetical protein